MIGKEIHHKMNGILLEGEALSRCAKSKSAMIHDEASSESIFVDLQQFEEEEQAGRTERQGAGDLFSDAEGSVASEAAVPFGVSVRGRCTAAPQFTRVVWALLRTLKQLKPRAGLAASYTTLL
jgi:DNA-binding PucR family transcriptional regulator